jgi:hypothetical protein
MQENLKPEKGFIIQKSFTAKDDLDCDLYFYVKRKLPYNQLLDLLGFDFPSISTNKAKERTKNPISLRIIVFEDGKITSNQIIKMPVEKDGKNLKEIIDLKQENQKAFFCNQQLKIKNNDSKNIKDYQKDIGFLISDSNYFSSLRIFKHKKYIVKIEVLNNFEELTHCEPYIELEGWGIGYGEMSVNYGFLANIYFLIGLFIFMICLFFFYKQDKLKIILFVVLCFLLSLVLLIKSIRTSQIHSRTVLIPEKGDIVEKIFIPAFSNLYEIEYRVKRFTSNHEEAEKVANLLGARKYLRKNEPNIDVSTNTVALQYQIFEEGALILDGICSGSKSGVDYYDAFTICEFSTFKGKKYYIRLKMLNSVEELKIYNPYIFLTQWDNKVIGIMQLFRYFGIILYIFLGLFVLLSSRKVIFRKN